MMTFSALPALLFYPAVMVWAGVGDLRTMAIPNRLILLLLAGYLAMAPFSGLASHEVGWNVGAACGVFVAALAAFARGFMGGGDVKLLAVAALWLGAANVMPFLFCTAVFGAILTLGILIFRALPLPHSWLRRDWILRLHARETGVPYGVAIAAAGLFLYGKTHWVAVWLPSPGAA